MTTISTADLTSELVDLTDVSLRELRTMSTSQLVHAMAWEVASSTTNRDEKQIQNQ